MIRVLAQSPTGHGVWQGRAAGSGLAPSSGTARTRSANTRGAL